MSTLQSHGDSAASHALAGLRDGVLNPASGRPIPLRDTRIHVRVVGGLAIVLSGVGLLVLVALGVGGLAAFSLRRNSTDSSREPLSRPVAVAATAPAGRVARPPPLDCTQTEGVSASAVSSKNRRTSSA